MEDVDLIGCNVVIACDEKWFGVVEEGLCPWVEVDEVLVLDCLAFF